MNILGFFHSWFKDEKELVWYVMGAYTFDAHFPFSLTGISKYLDFATLADLAQAA